MSQRIRRPKLLQDARVYLSGPMDFVANRADEKKYGWRNRVGEFLRRFGVTVFDPWTKPEIRGLHEFGREDERTTAERDKWTFRRGRAGAAARAACAETFWPMLHVDLRMVDTSDFVISYCPTNVYSVGTPHEIILCRQQRKPVLFVSPYVEFPSFAELEAHLRRRKDDGGLRLLKGVEAEVPIKPNPTAAPSLWYLPLVGGEHFFDGFGFSRYAHLFDWPATPLDAHERSHPPEKPLLPFLVALNRRLPQKWDRARRAFVPNDDWLFWKLSRTRRNSKKGEGTRRKP
jgi:hypothetical protein